MRGNLNLNNVKTEADYKLLSDAEKVEFKKLLKGTVVKEKDIAVYPAGYDFSLQDGDVDFISPVVVAYDDISVAARFGVTKAELDAL